MHFVGNVLFEGPAVLGVRPHTLGVADQHVDYLVSVANSGNVVVEQTVLRSTDDVDVTPADAAHRVGASLLVGPRDQHDRPDVEVAGLDDGTCEVDVLAGVGRPGLDEDRAVRDAEF